MYVGEQERSFGVHHFCAVRKKWGFFRGVYLAVFSVAASASPVPLVGSRASAGAPFLRSPQKWGFFRGAYLPVFSIAASASAVPLVGIALPDGAHSHPPACTETHIVRRMPTR